MHKSYMLNSDINRVLGELGHTDQLCIGETVELRFVTHAQLKQETQSCKAIVRTGEMTPYANIILTAACLF